MANLEHNDWSLANIPNQAGRRAIITGTGGLGFETALALAQANAEVIVAGRNESKGTEAVRRIQAATPGAAVRFEKLDLASLGSVAAFAQRMRAEGKAINILVNNAAVMSLPKRQVTADGYEMQLGTNYLGHFALTGGLLPLLLKANHARVVNLSSLAHRQGKIDFDDLQAERRYSPWGTYCQSKLAMLIFALELQRRSDAHGWRLISNSAHPGYARTDLIANGPGNKGPFAWMSAALGVVLSHSAAAGALPTLYAATATDATQSGYYGPDGIYELKGPVGPAYIAPKAKDHAVAQRLWAVSEKLTGVTWGTNRIAPAFAASR